MFCKKGFVKRIPKRKSSMNAPTKKNLLVLFFVSFAIRAITFHFFIAPYQRYRQADSIDYHNCAVSLHVGTGMHRADTLRPIFWRTPGYPAYLSFFYNLVGIESNAFSGAAVAQIIALWLQILLSSLVPIIIFYLAFLLTGILSVSWLTAWIYALHLGPVLASCFLLTEALAMIFFSLFLLFFYILLRPTGGYGGQESLSKQKPYFRWKQATILAALFLGIATWLRPMGEFVLVVAALLIFILDGSPKPVLSKVEGKLKTKTDGTRWKIKLKKVALLGFVFLLITGPWYLRNHKLTGKFFFCPMFGPYLNSFCAPKILRDKTGLPLEKCIQMQYRKAELINKKNEIAAYKKGKRGCRCFAPLAVALPIVKKYPFTFAYNWFKEVFKTTFDLYSSQLVAFANNSFTYDPLEEFLTEKWKQCLYKQKMPLAMRLVVFLELLFELLKWIGLILSLRYVLRPLFNKLRGLRTTQDSAYGSGLSLFLKTAPMIGAFIFMTGGFGYARLRLPIEPLMILLSLSSWYWLVKSRKKTK